MVGVSTPKSSAIFFWLSQKMSDSYSTSNRTAPAGVWYRINSPSFGAAASSAALTEEYPGHFEDFLIAAMAKIVIYSGISCRWRPRFSLVEGLGSTINPWLDFANHGCLRLTGDERERK